MQNQRTVLTVILAALIGVFLLAVAPEAATLLRVRQGGTGRGTATAYMPVTGGTTTLAPLQSVATGTADYPLCYVSSSGLPVWKILPIAGGGTGQVTAAAARVALLPSLTGNTLKNLRVNAGETDVEWATGGSGITGTGTDNHVMRWDGTTDAQDSGWVLSDTNQLSSDSGTVSIVLPISSGRVHISPAGGTDDALAIDIYADAVPRLAINSVGKLSWSDGSATADMSLERLAVGLLGGNLDASGDGQIPVEQFFQLNSGGSAITTIANFFGSTSNPTLVANAYYEIEIWLFFARTGVGTVTWTLTNSAAPTSQNIIYEESPVTGIVAPPGTATMLSGQTYNDATAAYTITSGSISSGSTNYAHIQIHLRNGSGTSLKIQATANAVGSLTPLIGSRWHCRRMPGANTGAFSS